MDLSLQIGTKVYRPVWKKGTPDVWEQEIVKCQTRGGVVFYFTKSEGFSRKAIGRSIFLTAEEAWAEHERIRKEYPNGLPLLKPTTIR